MPVLYRGSAVPKGKYYKNIPPPHHHDAAHNVPVTSPSHFGPTSQLTVHTWIGEHYSFSTKCVLFATSPLILCSCHCHCTLDLAPSPTIHHIHHTAT